MKTYFCSINPKKPGFLKKPGFYMLMFITLGCILSVIANSSISAADKPYSDFSKAGAEFYGQGREEEEPDKLKAVRIGLMGPEKTLEGKELQHGAALAVEQANARGGYLPAPAVHKVTPELAKHQRNEHTSRQAGHGIPYQIIFRPDDGPWGMAAKQVVNLTYDDKVWVILGGLDGHRTHLAELISAKAWIPIVTPTASDLSIDYANVPWVFRCMPSDARQAEILLNYARSRGYKNLIVLTEGQREAHTGFLRLNEVARRMHYQISMHIEYSPHNPTAILPRLKNIIIDAIIIWGNSNTVLPLLIALRGAGITAPVLAPAILATPQIAEKASAVGELIVAAPCDLSRFGKNPESPNESQENDSPISIFMQQYQKRTGTLPSPIALFAYDATRLVITAIERAGLNRAKIRDELSHISFDGITGTIHFDSLGGNPAQPVLMTLQNRQWIRVE
jgi:ABC-type branched-subunit amino acid transport system substrate-binding protein